MFSGAHYTSQRKVFKKFYKFFKGLDEYNILCSQAVIAYSQRYQQTSLKFAANSLPCRLPGACLHGSSRVLWSLVHYVRDFTLARTAREQCVRDIIACRVLRALEHYSLNVDCIVITAERNYPDFGRRKAGERSLQVWCSRSGSGCWIAGWQCKPSTWQAQPLEFHGHLKKKEISN